MKLPATAFLLILCAACSADSDALTPVDAGPIAYKTSTASAVANAPEGSVVFGETPLPTATPFAYTVQAGDTMSAIAARYGIPLDELQALNPGISATSMSIGTVLHIPSIPENPGGDSTPTPAPVSVEQVACYPTLDGGLWCFILVHNDAVQSLENVSAQVTVLDAGGVQIASQTALLPLNILEPNARLPLTTFFAPQIPARAHAQVQILTAMPVMADDGRYLPAEIRNTLVEVNWLGHSAMVSGQVFLPAGSGAAAQIWVAAAAYDRAGRVVGVRRWENNEALAGGDAMEFTFMVSSQAGGIGRVELAVEARP